MTVRELEAQLTHLDWEEKAHVFQRLALELTHEWPGVEKTPGVQGGEACIVRTRIPIWTLEAYRRLGWDDATLLDNFPTLRPVDLFYAWLYVAGNSQEIEMVIRKQDEA